MYQGCLTYADDITMVSPAVSGMQLLDICGHFAACLWARFNSKNSVAVNFVRNQRVSMPHPGFILGDHILSCKVEISHLGVALSIYGCDEVSVDARIRNISVL